MIKILNKFKKGDLKLLKKIPILVAVFTIGMLTLAACGQSSSSSTDSSCASGIYDCNNVCDGTAVYDDCGECGGDNSTCMMGMSGEFQMMVEDHHSDNMEHLEDLIEMYMHTQMVLPDDTFMITDIEMMPMKTKAKSKMPLTVLVNYVIAFSESEMYEFLASHDMSMDTTIEELTEMMGQMMDDMDMDNQMVTFVVGCSDEMACNYDENVNTHDDETCLYADCAGDCDGNAVIDECGECNGDGAPCLTGCDIDENSLYLVGNSVIYNSGFNIAGFQFDVYYGPVTNVYGGDSETNGFVLSSNSDNGRVVGYHPSNQTIPAGCGELLMIEGNNLIGLTDIIVSNSEGNDLEFDYFINNACDLPMNSIHLHGNEVWYHSTIEMAGFQFDITGDASLISASGGDAADYFTVNTGEMTVLGFDMNGNVLPPGCGILTTLNTNGAPDDLTNIIISDMEGNVVAFNCENEDMDAICDEFDSCIGHIDCLGICNGDAEVDCANQCEGGNELDNNDECCHMSEIDCEGNCFGTTSLDVNGDCCETEAQDCAGVCYGETPEEECPAISCFSDGTECILGENSAECCVHEDCGEGNYCYQGSTGGLCYGNSPPNDCIFWNDSMDIGCDQNENWTTEDCPEYIPVCGDGTCNGDETYETCPDDCPAPPECGDGTCNGDETMRLAQMIALLLQNAETEPAMAMRLMRLV